MTSFVELWPPCIGTCVIPAWSLASPAWSAVSLGDFKTKVRRLQR